MDTSRATSQLSFFLYHYLVPRLFSLRLTTYLVPPFLFPFLPF